MADMSVPSWLTAKQDWATAGGGSIAPTLGGLVSGYDAGIEAAKRRSFNKSVDAINAIRDEVGMPRLEKQPGNWFTDITSAAMGKGKYAENYIPPNERAAYYLKKRQVDSEAEYRANSAFNGAVSNEIKIQNELQKQRLKNLNDGALAAFSEKWNDLTELGLMGTPEALAELQGIIGKNPTISQNPFVLQGLRMAEDAIKANKSKGINQNSTITERDVALISDLRQQERDLLNQRKSAVSEEHLADIDQQIKDVRDDLSAARQMKGIVEQGAKPRIETIPDATGEDVKVLVGANGKTIKVLPRVDTSKLSQVEAMLLKKEAQAIDPESIAYMKKNKDGEWSFDSAAYQADLKKLEEKYTKKKPGTAAAAPAPTVTPDNPDPLGLFK